MNDVEQMRDYLSNYQIDKLDVLFPGLTNLFIILLFFALIAATIRKDKPDEKNFLGFSHTDHLRGFAIFFVVLRHLWVHVSQTQVNVVLPGSPVSLFLIISGFGLTLSVMRNKPKVQQYFSKTIKRVMTPYWMATILIVILDYFILGNLLRPRALLLTFLGINLGPELIFLDYSRWFVTFILVWYLFLFIGYKSGSPKHLPVYLTGIGLLLLIFNYYVFRLHWVQFLSFPAGCVLAMHYDRWLHAYRNNRKTFLVMSILAVLGVGAYNFAMSHEPVRYMVAGTIPNILLACLSEINSLVSNAGIICLFGYAIERGYQSRLLLLLGRYSYEIFLLHGVFLIKYNPLIKDPELMPLVLEFFLLMSIIVVLSSLAFKVPRIQYARR